MIKSDNAKADFTAVVKGYNFITPAVVGYYYQNDYAVELSRGYFDGDLLYGVTVVDTISGQHERELSKVCDSLAEARRYIKSL